MNTLTIILAGLSVILTVLVTLQSKGTGLSIIPTSQDFGKFERRGAEKVVHVFTIGLVALFLSLTVLSYFMA